jgi:hypothetical protein
MTGWGSNTYYLGDESSKEHIKGKEIGLKGALSKR